jgi:tetratricopeptide (TPR) repeat protein
MRPISYFLFGLSLLTIGGCGGGNIHSQLAEVDSLILSEQQDSAYNLLQTIKESDLDTDQDKAYYQLLTVQTSILTKRYFKSDSLIDAVIGFYQQSEDIPKLANAYYYKANSLLMNHSPEEAIVYLKQAEQLAKRTTDYRLRYKVAECISYLNSISGKYDLALDYVKEAFVLIDKIDNKRWQADAYYRMGISYANLNMMDSAKYYFDKTQDYIKYVREDKLPYFLTSIGMVYKDDSPMVAKKNFSEALAIKELTAPLEGLAEILYFEGKEEEAYQLWKKALTVNDYTPKDNIIHNLLEYDIEHGNTDKVCEQVNEIIAIKDSIINKVKNDTIKDLQTRYDHQVAMNAAHERTIWWQRSIGVLLVTILLVTIYAIRYRNKLKLKLKNRQIKINQYISQLNELESKKLQADLQISSLRDDKEKDCQEIISLKNQKSEADEEIQQLKKTIKDLSGQEISKIRIGYELLSGVEDNKCVRNWPTENYEAFLAYYDTINHDFLRNVAKKYKNLTPQNVFYLVLKNMKKSKDEIATIFGISKESLRSIEFRLNKKDKKKKN